MIEKQPSESEKFESTYDAGIETSGEDWLHLHRNENLFINDDWTVETAKEMIEMAHIDMYPEPTSIELRQAIAKVYDVESKNVFVGNGSDEVLADLFGYFRDTFDQVHLLDVCFKIYLLLAERYHYQVSRLPGNTFETGRVDVNGWSGLAIIDSPNAITSNKIMADNLMEIAAKDDTFVVWDNAYGEFAGDNLPTKPLKNMAILRTFSKYYGLAGLRVGYCIAHEDLVRDLLARKDAFNVNSFAQVMGREALSREPIFKAIALELIDCREILVENLRGLGFRVHEPSGNFVLATHPEILAKHIQAELITRHIAVRRFDDDLTANYIRITVSPMSGITKLTEALAEILELANVGQDSKSSAKNPE